MYVCMYVCMQHVIENLNSFVPASKPFSQEEMLAPTVTMFGSMAILEFRKDLGKTAEFHRSWSFYRPESWKCHANPIVGDKTTNVRILLEWSSPEKKKLEKFGSRLGTRIPTGFPFEKSTHLSPSFLWTLDISSSALSHAFSLTLMPAL